MARPYAFQQDARLLLNAASQDCQDYGGQNHRHAYGFGHCEILAEYEHADAHRRYRFERAEYRSQRAAYVARQAAALCLK